MSNKHSNCEVFEPLVSAMVDGELTEQERVHLRVHLEECDHCSGQLAAFKQVDETIRVPPRMQVNPLPVTLNGINSLPKTAKPVKRPAKSWSALRLIPLATAAALLLALGIMFTNDSKSATADQVTPEQIVEPMTDVYFINRQLQQDQQLMLRTLGMDLRLLKVEIAELEPGSVERELLNQRLDAMLEKVREFETKRQAETF